MKVAARGEARAGAEVDETQILDVALLYEKAAKDAGEPARAAILRPGSLLHLRFCAATMQLMDTVLALAAPVGPRLWRYLVTQPPGLTSTAAHSRYACSISSRRFFSSAL